MFIQMFTFGMFFANCYVVGCEETKKAAVIDPTFDRTVEAEQVLAVLSRHGFKGTLIVNTHGHPDHTVGNGILKKATGAPILIHENDAAMLAETSGSFPSIFGMRTRTPPADVLLTDGDTVQVGKIPFTVLHTPGHTRGSICLFGDKVVFTGDTLFAGSIGRTDFPGGSFDDIIRSIKTKLFPLPDHVTVYSGHGPVSTIAKERRYNPFLQS